jgi:hypothetical protein
MHLQDFDGVVQIEREDDLAQLLRSKRRGDYGAFILWHRDGGPSLWIHTYKQLAYLHFFLDDSEKHPGFQSQSVTSITTEQVHFLQTNGIEADSIDAPPDTVVPIQQAYEAARAFFRNPERPESVTWFEL